MASGYHRQPHQPHRQNRLSASSPARRTRLHADRTVLDSESRANQRGAVNGSAACTKPERYDSGSCPSPRRQRRVQLAWRGEVEDVEALRRPRTLSIPGDDVGRWADGTPLSCTATPSATAPSCGGCAGVPGARGDTCELNLDHRHC